MHVTRILIELLCCIDIKKTWMQWRVHTYFSTHPFIFHVLNCLIEPDICILCISFILCYNVCGLPRGPIKCQSLAQFRTWCSILSPNQPHVLQSHFSQRSCPLFIRSFMFQTLFSLLQLNFTHFWWFCYFCDRIRHVRNHFPPLMFRRLWKMIPCKILAI